MQRWEELGHTQHAMWADNMFSRHFLTNPMRSNVSADLSVIMVVPTRRRLPVFVGHKHIVDVRLSVNSTATLVQQSVPHLLQGIRFTLRNIKREFLRIPLDIVRPVLEPLRWKPLADRKAGLEHMLSFFSCSRICGRFSSARDTQCRFW